HRQPIWSEWKSRPLAPRRTCTVPEWRRAVRSTRRLGWAIGTILGHLRAFQESVLEEGQERARRRGRRRERCPRNHQEDRLLVQSRALPVGAGSERARRSMGRERA